jgi:hypothetical protein
MRVRGEIFGLGILIVGFKTNWVILLIKLKKYLFKRLD